MNNGNLTAYAYKHANTLTDVGMLLLPLLFAVAYIGYHDWGMGLISPYRYSDAEHYLHYAWMKVFIDASGGSLGEVVPPSPYTLLLITAYQLFGNALYVPYLCNALLFATTVFLTYKLTVNLFDRNTGITAGIITAFCGPLLFFTGMTVKVIGMAAFMSGSLYFLHRYYRLHKLTDLAVFGIFASLLTLERNNFLLFLPLLPLLTLLPSRTPKVMMMRAAVLVISIAATVMPVYSQFHQAHPTSPVGTNFYIGNSKIATGAYSPIPGFRNDLIGHHTAMYRYASTAAPDWWWIRKTIADITEQPLHFAAVMLRKTIMLFSAYSPDAPDQYPVWRWRDSFLSIAIFDYGLILALAVPGLCLAQRQMQDKKWLRYTVIALLAYAASIGAFFVLERYRVPLMLAMIPYAAFMWQQMIRHPKKYIKTVAALYLLTHIANLANPAGPGWGHRDDKAFAQLLKWQQQNQQVHTAKQNALTTHQAEYWDQLAEAYYKRRLIKDGELFLSRYNAAIAENRNTRHIKP